MRAKAHRLRAGRVSLSGQYYLVTTVTMARAPLLQPFWSARAVVRELSRMESEGTVCTLAFVVMPDHLHWLFELRATTLAEILRRFKSRSARAVNRVLGRQGKLWQPGYHDHALRREDSLRDVIRYLVLNPVRAGLAHRAGNWPHWDIRIGWV